MSDNQENVYGHPDTEEGKAAFAEEFIDTLEAALAYTKPIGPAVEEALRGLQEFIDSFPDGEELEDGIDETADDEVEDDADTSD